MLLAACGRTDTCWEMSWPPQDCEQSSQGSRVAQQRFLCSPRGHCHRAVPPRTRWNSQGHQLHHQGPSEHWSQSHQLRAVLASLAYFHVPQTQNLGHTLSFYTTLHKTSHPPFLTQSWVLLASPIIVIPGGPGTAWVETLDTEAKAHFGGSSSWYLPQQALQNDLQTLAQTTSAFPVSRRYACFLRSSAAQTIFSQFSSRGTLTLILVLLTLIKTHLTTKKPR